MRAGLFVRRVAPSFVFWNGLPAVLLWVISCQIRDVDVTYSVSWNRDCPRVLCSFVFQFRHLFLPNLYERDGVGVLLQEQMRFVELSSVAYLSEFDEAQNFRDLAGFCLSSQGFDFSGIQEKGFRSWEQFGGLDDQG